MPDLEGIWWSVAGEGPAVVIPWLNVDWSGVDLQPLIDTFRVVTVAPRGFGPSTRKATYADNDICSDVLAVLDHLSIESFATFGYSMSGMLAARLALGNRRVSAVVCGGFPLAADLEGMGSRARTRNEDAQRDGTWRDVVAAFDPMAAVALWDDVSRLPPGALMSVDCPMRAWWGERDEILSSLIDPQILRQQLEDRGITCTVVPGLAHDEMLESIHVLLPDLVLWLQDHVGG